MDAARPAGTTAAGCGPQEHYQEHYEEQEPEYQPSPVHPLHRYAAQHAALPETGNIGTICRSRMPGRSPIRRATTMRCTARSNPASRTFSAIRPIPTIPYAYQSGYEEEEPAPRKRGGLMTVVAVLALAVVGTGGAFAYRTYVGSPRSGEPPIIKADNSPTKVVPAPADGVAKTPDRMTRRRRREKLVPREETPVDVNARSAVRASCFRR